MGAEDRGWGPPCKGTIVKLSVAGIVLYVRREVAPIFGAFITELVTSKHYPVAGGTPDDWGVACRYIAGTTVWSNHAWGLAIDLNSLRNPMRRPFTSDMPAGVSALAAKYGLRWGGDYSTTPDPMHFEFMGTPGDAASRVGRLSATPAPPPAPKPPEDDLTPDDRKWMYDTFARRADVGYARDQVMSALLGVAEGLKKGLGDAVARIGGWERK